MAISKAKLAREHAHEAIYLSRQSAKFNTKLGAFYATMMCGSSVVGAEAFTHDDGVLSRVIGATATASAIVTGVLTYRSMENAANDRIEVEKHEAILRGDDGN